MRFSICLSCILVATSGSCSTAWAQGFLGGQSGLDPKFCETAALRQTVVYVDDMFMQDGQTEWANKLFEKLKATLVPSERVTVVELSPADGQSREVWSGCWPDYSQQERDRLAKSYTFFSRDPLKSLEDQQGFFASGFAGGLSEIYDKHHHAKTIIDPSNAPSKAIIAALSSDGARYAQTTVTIRAILYSDLAENSELASVFRPQPVPAVDFGKKLGTYLRCSVFYVFGVGDDVGGGEKVREATRAFWTTALESMSVAVGELGSDLSVPNVRPVAAREFTIDLERSNQALNGRLSLLADSDGELVDSWIGIYRYTSATLSGTIRCDTGENGTCTVYATTSHGILSTSPSEVLTLRGEDSKPLKGMIGVKGYNSLMYSLTATAKAQ